VLKLDKINLREKFQMFNEYWSPRIIGEVNDSYVKLAKFKGEFTWHVHDHEDEMFYVVKGKLTIKFKEKDIFLEEGESIIIPKGIEHMPCAEEEVHILLIEPKTTLNTGNILNEKTVEKLERI
jgi:mannose-6-phosphate isomerase-like protein (cupin superfamily)